MLQANGADCRSQYTQRALSRQIVAGRPGECKKIILRPFLAGILTLKTVLQSAPEHAIFIQKIEKKFTHSIGAYTAPRPVRLRRSTLASPLQNPRYATGRNTTVSGRERMLCRCDPVSLQSCRMSPHCSRVCRCPPGDNSPPPAVCIYVASNHISSVDSRAGFSW